VIYPIWIFGKLSPLGSVHEVDLATAHDLINQVRHIHGREQRVVEPANEASAKRFVGRKLGGWMETPESIKAAEDAAAFQAALERAQSARAPRK